jgi:hypothetical protein
MKGFKIIFLVIIFSFYSNIHAQRWRAFRWDAQFGVGTSHFFGDLGGGNSAPAHTFLTFRDMDIGTTRWVVQAGLRYKLRDNLSIKTNFSFARLYGDDQESGAISRKIRNLQFRSPIAELGTQLEFSFIKEKIGSRYAISRTNIRNLINAYFFAGVGGFWFNPQTLYNGTWYNLQPLGTEGQGLGLNPPKYTLIQLCFPVGLGVKYTLSKELSVGIEIGNRYTSTDYIDDVGGEYFNFEQELAAGNITREEFAPIAAVLADRHLDAEGHPTEKFATGAGYRSGTGNYTDAYVFVIFNISYKLQFKGGFGIPKF